MKQTVAQLTPLFLLLGGMTIVLAVAAALVFLLQKEVAATQSLERELALLGGRQAQVASLRPLLAGGAKIKEAVATYFITESSLPGFLEQLEKLATSTEVALELTNAEVVAEKQTRVALAFKVSGSFQGVFHFISLLDVFPVKLRFRQIELQRTSSLKGPARWDAVFVVDLLSFVNNNDE